MRALNHTCHIIFLLVIFLGIPILSQANDSPNFTVRGIKGKFLKNIQTRLNESEENHPLYDQSDEEIRLNITKALYPYGYFKPEIQITRQSKHRLLFIVNPGSRLLIDKLDIHLIGEGKDNPEINQAVNQLPIEEKTPFNSTKYELAKQKLLTAAEHQGYLHASFEKAEILIDKKSYSAVIHWVFNTGQQYFFGQVQFDPTYISPELLRRYMPFHYGQPYSNDQLIALNNALLGSGYFKTVTIKPQESITTTTHLPIDVHLQPIAPVNYSLGLGYGTDTGIRGRAGYHVIPVNRWGHKFNAVALGSFRENGVQTQYIIPGKNPLMDQVELLGGLSNLHYNAGNSNSLLLSMAQRHNLAHFQRVLSLNGLYERFDYTYQPKEEKFVLYPKISLTWLNRSEGLFSPNGYKIAVNGLVANKALLSEINFTQASLDAKAALTFPWLGTRFYFHTIQGITQVNNVYQLPLSLALLLGGSDNLKGYSYNSIGPGKILSYGGLEIQKETKENWYLVGFMDVGDIYRPTPKLMQKDLGLALMWVSPVGPIKIGIAQPVDNQLHRVSHSKPRLVISMGPDL